MSNKREAGQLGIQDCPLGAEQGADSVRLESKAVRPGQENRRPWLSDAEAASFEAAVAESGLVEILRASRESPPEGPAETETTKVEDGSIGLDYTITEPPMWEVVAKGDSQAELLLKALIEADRARAKAMTASRKARFADEAAIELKVVVENVRALLSNARALSALPLEKQRPLGDGAKHHGEPLQWWMTPPDRDRYVTETLEELQEDFESLGDAFEISAKNALRTEYDVQFQYLTGRRRLPDSAQDEARHWRTLKTKALVQVGKIGGALARYKKAREAVRRREERRVRPSAQPCRKASKWLT